MFDWVLTTPLYYLFAKVHRMSTKLSPKSFSVKLSEILIVLYRHNRSTFQKDKLKNRAKQVKQLS